VNSLSFLFLPFVGHQALLQGASGTWAERVAVLFVLLARALHLEAVQLSGFWRDSSSMGGLVPGSRLTAHNHSWVAVKVNGRWRLLDCAYAALR
jgi:transglutaminase/protease-like cytokinesis protein 3